MPERLVYRIGKTSKKGNRLTLIVQFEKKIIRVVVHNCVHSIDDTIS